MYFSAKTQQFFTRPDLYGCMFSYRKTGGQDAALKAGCKWMLDNGAFTGNFHFREWVYQLAVMRPYRHNCLGIVTPDEPYNAKDTLRKFYQYRSVPDALGYRIAFATQDGMTPEMIPWQLFNVLFVGGSDRHKRGVEAQVIARAAIKMGKWIHVGRVSSGMAINKHWPWANSYDGTTFCFDGGNNPVDKKMGNMTPVLERKKTSFQWRLL